MLKYEKDKEKMAFKQMPFKKKIEHIWEYYRLTIVLSLVGIIMLGWILNHYIINPPKDPSVMLLFHSYAIDYDALDELSLQLAERFPDLYTDRTEIQLNYNATGMDDQGTEAVAATKMIVLVAAGDIDLIAGSYDEMYSDAFNSYLMPLDDVFTEEEMEKLAALAPDDEESGNGIYNVSPGDVDENSEVILLEERPFFVNISQNEALKKVTGEKQIYLGVSCTSKHLDAAKELFWAFLQDE